MNDACGNSANIEQTRILLAEIPQMTRKTECYLRKFRRYQTKMQHICGTSASKMQKKNVSLQRANAHKPKQNQFISI